MAVGGGRRDAQRCGRLGDRQAGKVAELDEGRLGRIDQLKALQRLVEGDDVGRDFGGGQFREFEEVKRELSFGERERLSNVSLKSMKAVTTDGETVQEIGIDMARFKLERILAWVIDWSAKGKINRDTVAALKPSIADEIEKALDAHI